MKSIEVETVTLKMKPVCKCGYVFDELICSAMYTNYNGIQKKDTVFSPQICPTCGRYIESVTCKFPDENNDEFDFSYSWE